MKICRDCAFFKADLNTTVLPGMAGCGMLGECRLTGKCVPSRFTCVAVSDSEEDTGPSWRRYAHMFPDEIRDMVTAMSSEMRWAILGALVSEGELQSKDLEKLLGDAEGVEAPLSHLKALERAGLVECVLKEDAEVYRISLLGWRLMFALLDVFYCEAEGGGRSGE